MPTRTRYILKQIKNSFNVFSILWKNHTRSGAFLFYDECCKMEWQAVNKLLLGETHRECTVLPTDLGSELPKYDSTLSWSYSKCLYRCTCWMRLLRQRTFQEFILSSRNLSIWHLCGKCRLLIHIIKDFYFAAEISSMTWQPRLFPVVLSSWVFCTWQVWR